MTGLLLLGTPAMAETPKKKPATSTKKKVAKKAEPEKSSDSEAQALYRDAANLLRGQQYAEAETVAKRCIDADPQFADCHMLLGAARSGQKNYDEAVEAYRAFLRLAPDHRLAAKVRETVENYEQSKSP
jgi:tetratricopeptide (TPR) repeat protein